MKGNFLLFPVVLLFAACSFDYSDLSGSDKGKPDIVMENLEYVRVRGGEPQVRFRAEYAERWEESQHMEIRAFSFEQLQNNGEEINAEGRAGIASVQLDTGDVSLMSGVRINIESEDIIIMTRGLEWKDKEKLLLGARDDEVNIERSDGTIFSGWGFTADIRNRSWTFSGEVKGTYVEEDDEEDGEGAAGDQSSLPEDE